MQKKVKILIIMLLLIGSFFTTGFTKISNKPQTVYRVYLKGVSIGLINYKTSFESYIDKKQEEIKKTVRKMIPANITLEVTLRYNLYGEIKPYTYGDLKRKQFRYIDVREEDIRYWDM